MRLTLVIDGLGAGGAQRVVTTMANYWAGKGWPVTLLTLEGKGEPPAFSLDADVAVVRLGTVRPDRGALVQFLGKRRHIPALRQAMREGRPDVVVSFIDRVNVLTLLAARGLAMPVVVSERTEPAAYDVGWLWERLRAWTYPSARALVAQSATALRYLPPAPGRLDRVIPNPVVAARPASDRATRADAEPHVVVGMGRLGPEKGFDLLVEAFGRIASRFPRWNLEIWGEGPTRVSLERQVSGLGLTSRVRLPGRTAEPLRVLGASDLFVLSSRFEGFPNALGEAMACGLPVISYDCPSGPREVVRDGLDGLLVPPEGGVEALSAALARLMEDPEERQRLALRAPEVLGRFALERVMGAWEQLLAEVLGERVAG